MARPLASGKKAVDLAGGPRRAGSRIRRDPPPPPPKAISPAEVRERETWVVVIGLMVFAMTLAVLLLAAARWAGWSPADYTIRFEDRL